MSYKNRLGRAGWKFLHTMADGWNTDPDPYTTNNFRHFLYYLSEIYPCKTCRNHMKQYFRLYPPIASKKYLIDFHNNVNLRLKKPIYIE